MVVYYSRIVLQVKLLLSCLLYEVVDLFRVSKINLTNLVFIFIDLYYNIRNRAGVSLNLDHAKTCATGQMQSNFVICLYFVVLK